ncbi:hypothetical protein C8K44_106179 [Aminobacter sp. AP02]|nr:hypothetical protein C8K44_106179 [Aminobacter sp. AP02]
MREHQGGWRCHPGRAQRDPGPIDPHGRVLISDPVMKCSPGDDPAVLDDVRANGSRLSLRSPGMTASALAPSFIPATLAFAPGYCQRALPFRRWFGKRGARPCLPIVDLWREPRVPLGVLAPLSRLNAFAPPAAARPGLGGSSPSRRSDLLPARHRRFPPLPGAHRSPVEDREVNDTARLEGVEKRGPSIHGDC